MYCINTFKFKIWTKSEEIFWSHDPLLKSWSTFEVMIYCNKYKRFFWLNLKCSTASNLSNKILITIEKEWMLPVICKGVLKFYINILKHFWNFETFFFLICLFKFSFKISNYSLALIFHFVSLCLFSDHSNESILTTSRYCSSFSISKRTCHAFSFCCYWRQAAASARRIKRLFTVWHRIVNHREIKIKLNFKAYRTKMKSTKSIKSTHAYRGQQRHPEVEWLIYSYSEDRPIDVLKKFEK